MKYSVERIIRNLWRQKAAYLVIFTEFVFGVAIFSVCMSYLFTTTKLLREYKESRAGKEVHVECYSTEVSESSSSETVIIDTKAEYETVAEIDYETYENIYETYTEDLEILFSSSHVVNWILWEEEEVDFVYVVKHYMNDEMFRYLYGFEREPDRLYLGEQAYEALVQMEQMRNEAGEDGVQAMDVGEIRLEGDVIITTDGQRRPFQVVHLLDAQQEVVDKVVFADEDDFEDVHTDMADVVILPVAEVKDIPESTYAFSALFLKSNLTLMYRDADSREDIIPEILLELTEAQENCMYVADNAYLSLKQEIESLEYDTYNWVLMSVSMILLSGIGCVGYLFLQMNKRKHAMAVAIAYGSTYRRMVAENLLEVFVVFAAGGILGVLISPKFRGILLYRGRLEQGVELYLLIGAIILAFTVLAVGLGMHEVRKKDIVKSLREE